MCLAVPLRVKKIISPVEAEVESLGIQERVRTDFLDEVEVGDYLLVHAGCAIEKLDLKEAQKTLSLWAEVIGENNV